MFMVENWCSFPVHGGIAFGVLCFDCASHLQTLTLKTLAVQPSSATAGPRRQYFPRGPRVYFPVVFWCIALVEATVLYTIQSGGAVCCAIESCCVLGTKRCIRARGEHV